MWTGLLEGNTKDFPNETNENNIIILKYEMSTMEINIRAFLNAL